MFTVPLVAVWVMLPCSSSVTTDHVTRTTTAEVCPNTFGEVQGPFLAKGWRPPQGASAPVAASTSPQKKAHKKRKLYWKKRKHS